MWAQFLNIWVGVWLMAAPAVLDFDSLPAASNNYITGPLIVAFSIIALWEVTRSCRWIAFVTGAWLIIAPFVLGHWVSEPVAAVSDICSGALAALLSVFPGRIRSRFGRGWSNKPGGPAHPE